MGFSQAPGLPYSKLGIPEDGDAASQAISKGKYVIWKGKNYFAKTDILQGETFVEDTNLTEIPDGALNGIADALNSSINNYFPNGEYSRSKQLHDAAPSNSTFSVDRSGIYTLWVAPRSSNYCAARIKYNGTPILYTVPSDSQTAFQVYLEKGKTYTFEPYNKSGSGAILCELYY